MEQLPSTLVVMSISARPRFVSERAGILSQVSRVETCFLTKSLNSSSVIDWKLEGLDPRVVVLLVE